MHANESVTWLLCYDHCYRTIGGQGMPDKDTQNKNTSNSHAAKSGVVASGLSRHDSIAMTWTIILTMFCNGFMITLMSVTLPDVSKQFHVSVAQANWIILAFTIVGATMIAMGARFLHRWGVKAIFCTATALMCVGGLVGFFAVDFWMVMAARILQACASGLLFPSASTALIKIVEPGKRAFNLSLFTAFGGVGFAISPFVAGLLIANFNVNAVFIPTAIVGILCCIASAITMKPIGEREADATHIDPFSVVLIFVGLACFMFGISEINHKLMTALILICVGALVLILFAIRQRNLKTPLLDLSPLANKSFMAGVMLLMFGSLAEHAVRLTAPLYLEGAVSFDASQAGLFMLLPQLAYSGVSLFAGKVTDKHGIWPIVPLGFLVISLGFIGFFVFAELRYVVPLLVIAIFILAGVGFVSSPNRATALEALNAEQLAAGASIASVAIQLASSLSSALLVGTLSNRADALIHAGTARDAAYVAGFQEAVIIMVIIEIAMLVFSAFYTHRLYKKSVHRKEQNG